MYFQKESVKTLSRVGKDTNKEREGMGEKGTLVNVNIRISKYYVIVTLYHGATTLHFC